MKARQFRQIAQPCASTPVARGQAEQAYRAGSGTQQAQYQLDGRGLARTIRSQQAKHVAARDGKVDPPQRGGQRPKPQLPSIEQNGANRQPEHDQQQTSGQGRQHLRPAQDAAVRQAIHQPEVIDVRQHRPERIHERGDDRQRHGGRDGRSAQTRGQRPGKDHEDGATDGQRRECRKERPQAGEKAGERRRQVASAQRRQHERQRLRGGQRQAGRAAEARIEETVGRRRQHQGGERKAHARCEAGAPGLCGGAVFAPREGSQDGRTVGERGGAGDGGGKEDERRQHAREPGREKERARHRERQRGGGRTAFDFTADGANRPHSRARRPDSPNWW